MAISAISSHWKDLLANPGPDGHIVQLYQDNEFFTEAICHFAAEGLVKGESIIFVATKQHWNQLSRRLTSKGFKVPSLRRQGQLTVLDADKTLPHFLVNNMPHRKTFKTLASNTIEKARGAGKYPRVRWWGEMVNVLYVDGNQRGSTRLEELFHEVGHEETIAIFCSFFMDKFDPKIYDGPLQDVCRTHHYLIPADDYGYHRNTVDKAIATVFGTMEYKILKLLAASKQWPAPGMPPSQALLLYLKRALPDKFDLVLQAARKHEKQLMSRRQRDSRRQPGLEEQYA